MNRYILLSVLITVACQPSRYNGELSLIPASETVERIHEGNFDYAKARFVKQDRSDLTEEDRELLNQGKLAKDYYEDSEGVIREVRVRPIELVDQLVEIQRRAAFSNALEEIGLLNVDCNAYEVLYDEVQQRDQEVRQEGGDMQAVDEYNLQIVHSLLTNCGWPEEEYHLFTIWLVFQHSPAEVMAYYFPTLKEYSEKGLLSKSSIALMEDRLLMFNGYPQRYGSQISNGGLYKLQNPDSVNVWRARMELDSIEEYIANWDLDFEDEVERMKEVD